MSRLDPSRLTDMSVDATSSGDQAQVSLDEPKRSAMVGQEIKAKIIQARHNAAAACSQESNLLRCCPPSADGLQIHDTYRQTFTRCENNFTNMMNSLVGGVICDHIHAGECAGAAARAQ